MRNRCDGLVDVWNAGTMSELGDDQGCVEKKRTGMSKVSFREMKIILNQTGRRLPALRFRCRITVPAVLDVISRSRFVLSRRALQRRILTKIFERNIRLDQAAIVAFVKFHEDQEPGKCANGFDGEKQSNSFQRNVHIIHDHNRYEPHIFLLSYLAFVLSRVYRPCNWH